MAYHWQDQRQLLRLAIEETLADNHALVGQWRAGTPGAWGALAGKAIIAARARLGHRLSESERRLVWAMLWQRLSELNFPDGEEWTTP
jgi:hypothetical protein